MAGPIFLDNTVLFYFGLEERADLIYSLWGEKACTIEAVIREYRAGVSVAGVSQDAWEDLPVVPLSEAEQSWIAELPPYLDAGNPLVLPLPSTETVRLPAMTAKRGTSLAASICRSLER